MQLKLCQIWASEFEPEFSLVFDSSCLYAKSAKQMCINMQILQKHRTETFKLKFAGSNAAEIELHLSLDCNSKKIDLKLAGSNAAEMQPHLGLECNSTKCCLTNKKVWACEFQVRGLKCTGSNSMDFSCIWAVRIQPGFYISCPYAKSSAQLQLHLSMDCNSTKFELKFTGSNAAEFALHLSLRNSGANFMFTIWGSELKHV